jgi:GTP-binding protein
VLVADPDLRDLAAFRGKTRYAGERGGSGRGSHKRGADGADVELHVPVGTQVFDDEGRLLVDLAHPEARAVLAHGGLGGAGNSRFRGPTRQAPRIAEVGESGEEAALELRLKLLADAALLGFPNAGKSSLLRRLSNAKPKVADYPFTTIAPVLGTVDHADGRQLTVADVPGLLEGAHQGVGLGDEFLAHLERARLLLHVIDASEPDPEDRFRTIDTELAAYGAGLAERPQIVVLNKVDLLLEPPAFDVEDPRILRVVPVSAATGAGIDDLRTALFELVPPQAPAAPAAAEPLADFLVYRPQATARRRVRVYRTERGYRVSGSPSEEELETALRQAGAKVGDEITVGERTYEWQ